MEKEADLDVEYKACSNCRPLLYSLQVSMGRNSGPEIAELLYSRNASMAGSTPSGYGIEGFTVSHYAAANGFVGLLCSFLHKKIRMMEELACRTIHPIHIAVARNQIKSVEALISLSEGLYRLVFH